MGNEHKHGILTKKFPPMNKVITRISGPVSPIRPASEKNEFSKKEEEEEKEGGE